MLLIFLLLLLLANPNLCAPRLSKDPEVELDIVPKTSSSSVKKPDYGDYEDYELTTRAPLDELLMEVEKHSLDEEITKLMSDLHREEQRVSQRTTVTKEEMMATSTVAGLDVEEEGSGESVTTTTMTTRAPRLYTTVVQEVNNVPSTLRPDPYANVDYDLSDHSNIRRPKPAPKIVVRPKTAKIAAPQRRLHGGDVAATFVIVKAEGGKKKYLKKLAKIDKRNKLVKLNGKLYRIGPKMKLKKITSRGRVTVKPEVFSTNVTAKSKPKKSRKRPISNRRKRQLEFQDIEPEFIYQQQELTQVEPSPIVYEVAAELQVVGEPAQHSGLAQVNLVNTLDHFLNRRYSLAG